MKGNRFLIAVVVLTVLLPGLLLVGCGQSMTTAPPKPPASTSQAPATSAAPVPATTSAVASPKPSSPASTAPAAAEKPLVLDILVGFAPSHTDYKDWVGLQTQVEKVSGGKIKLNLLGATDVMDRTQMPNAVRKGMAQASVLYGTQYQDLVPANAVLNASRFLPDEERKRGMFDALQVDHAKVGLYLLGRTGVAPNYKLVSLKKPVTKMEEWKGIKMGGGADDGLAYSAWGATPVVMSSSNYYNGLQTSVIDGCIRSAGGVVEFSLWEVCKYFVDHYLGCGSTVTIINLDTWNKLTAEQKNFLNQAELLAEKQSMDYQNGIAFSARDRLIKEGMTAIKFSATDAEKYIGLFYDALWGKLTKDLGADVTAKYKKMLS